MPELLVTDRKGDSRKIEVAEGTSVMESLREAGFDEIMALCGGCCSCATCHVYVEPSSSAASLPPITDDENALLDSSLHRRDASRLSCQLPVTADLEGLSVTIAPEE